MFYCGHDTSSTWFDWSTQTRFCMICGYGACEDGGRSRVSPDLLAVRRFCVDGNEGRGIWKVLDENRQLGRNLAEEGLLEKYPWLEGWQSRTDRFLMELINYLHLPQQPFQVPFSNKTDSKQERSGHHDQ